MNRALLALSAAASFLLTAPAGRADEIDDLFSHSAQALKAGNYDAAVNDATRILQLDPNQGGAYVTRSAAYVGKKEYARAIADANAAMKFPLGAEDLSMAYNNRGSAYRGLDFSDFTRYMADYRRAIELNPENAVAQSNLSWELSTNPLLAERSKGPDGHDSPEVSPLASPRPKGPDGKEIPKGREGEKALELAQKAYELAPKDPNALEALAAAYAELGDVATAPVQKRDYYEKAAATQKSAIQEFNSLRKDLTGSDTVADDPDMVKRLHLYEDKKPYRETPPTP